jgi:hypothetical protein
MNPLAMLGLGFSVGMALLSTQMQVQRRRQREALQRLLEQGEFQLLKRGGERAAADELTNALDAALGFAVNPAQRRRRLVLVFAAMGIAFVTAYAAFVIAGRSHQ